MSQNLDKRHGDDAGPHALGRIACRLSELAAEWAALGFDPASATSASVFAQSPDPLVRRRASDFAQRILGYLVARRARNSVLDGDWFADPAWDLLLDLLASQYLGRRVSISSACIAANVPPTTALRWIEKLVLQGLLVREDDPMDRRRTHLGIAPVLAARLEQWVECYLPPPAPTGPAIGILSVEGAGSASE
ncbi:hypothetical protein [Sphingomonas koreensis]